jgi:hypothetical protein
MPLAAGAMAGADAHRITINAFACSPHLPAPCIPDWDKPGTEVVGARTKLPSSGGWSRSREILAAAGGVTGTALLERHPRLHLPMIANTFFLV